VLGDSLKKSFTSRSWNPPWVFGAGFVSGLMVAVAIGSLRPTLTSMWLQRAPADSPPDEAPVPIATENREADEESPVARELTQGMGDLAPYFTVVHAARLTRERVEMEAAADANLKRSKELAVQGIAVRDAGRDDGEETLEELQHQEYLWEAALRQLDQIPDDSILAEVVAERREAYSAILGPVQEDIDELQSVFLADIAEATGRPHAIRITICHLSGECRDYKGDQPPASPASLIKVPVAVVLMHKVTEEGIDLSDPMYIDSHNWTENANGAKIYVKQEYPIREVMVRMIKESNNIATNQLIDYLGWDYMDATLEELGYEQTKIRSKLIGDRTAPTRNRTVGRNVITTNEVTEMMRQIYTFTHPGDEEILDGMVGQYDWEFGYTAISQLRNKRVAWIGEKTGQNSNVIGSSVAVKIDDERYIVTVTIDNSANQRMLRQVIGDTIQHILDEGHLVRVNRS
jgi:beta-lactamase class A